AFIVGGIDVRRAEVHRTRIAAAHLLPRRACVFRAVRARFGRVLDERDEHVGVRLRNGERDAPLVAGGNAVAETAPGSAAVGGLVDAAAPRRALAVVLFTGASPDDPRVAGENGEVAEGVVRLAVEDRLPERALIGGLPDAARRGGDIYGRRIFGVDFHIVDSATGGGGTDRSEVERVERRLRARDARDERGEASEAQSETHGERLRCRGS